MHNAMSELLDRYEAGLMSRRELLGALIGIALPSTPVQQGKPLIGTATQLNHVTLYVHDVSRSQEFYQKLFGMPVLTRQNAGVNLRAGAGFVGLYPAGDGGPPRIDHMCLSVDHFDAATVLRELNPLKLNAEIVRRGDTEELYFDDPDGISVQIQDTSYRGGVGRLGNRNP
jgi:catechol 2,3-dioxygenase-like lactoylglutathione lyase family enzyme